MKRILLLGLVAMFAFSAAWAQRSVTGTVTAKEDGTPVPGVNVIVKGTAAGTVTDIDGKYQIGVPEEGGTLVFSFIGLTTEEVEIGNQSEIDMVMTADIKQLTEVVVTALGITREKASLGYAVQEVEGEELNNVKQDNFINSLSGRVAGLHVKNNTNFGGSTNVIIRGSSSLTGSNQALFVIDGVPISNSNTNNTGQTTGRAGFDYGNYASDLQPNDIESVSVLKGAAATALYGSRAANGVILITTKKGKKGAKGIGVTINSNVTFGTVDKSTFPNHQKLYGAGYDPAWHDEPGLDLIDVNGDGTPEPVVPVYDDASRGGPLDGTPVYQYNAFIPESPFYGQMTPYVYPENDAVSFFETAVNYTNSFDISNANDYGSYRFSYTNMNNSGVMPNSLLRRNNFVLTGSYNILDNVKITAHANYIKTDGKGRPSTGYSDNIMSSFRQWYQVNVDMKEQRDLYFANTDQNPTWNPAAWNDRTPIYWDNPYWVRYKNYQTDERSRLIGYVQLDYEITKFLSLMGRMAVDTYGELQEERKAVGSVAGELGVDRPDVTSGYSRYERSFYETNADLMLNFHKTYGNFDVAAMLGTNIRRSRSDRIFASTNGGLAVPDVYSLSNSVDPMLPPEERLLEKGVNGFFGSLNLGYKNFLYLDATVRRDQSSTLPSNNNAYVYPSVSGSFVFSEIVEANWLSLGKVRLNYAEVGNDTDPLRVLDTYRANAPFKGNPLVTNYFLKNNPDLKPERQQSIEAGLEFSVLDDRLGIDVAVYKTSTFDQLMPVSVSWATGYREKMVNAGEIENKGAEVMLYATPIRSNGFQWDITLNWSKNQNKVISLFTDEAGNEVENLQLASLQGGVTINARVGEPYGTINGSDYTYHENGGKIVRDDGSRYIKSATNDQVLGNFNPDWLGGIRNAFSYKNFDFSFLIDWQHGGDVFSLDMWYGTGTGMYEETATPNDLGNPQRDPVIDNGDGTYGAESGGIILDGVYADGTPNTTRIKSDIFAHGWVRSPNARYVYDASFVKLREVVLTYNLPQSILERSPFTGVALSFVGNNLAIFHKNLPHADPEATQGSGNIQGWQSGVMPAVKNYGFNVNLKF
ncbi:MAG: SusC/RagA family TonB-linked outer membrane protein [Cytophagales bacterium]|nr:SusC/RagA family TonB-linked outer membrane protein [Cytophagales bacterium]